MKASILIAVATILVCQGCGVVAKVQARDDMMQAKSAYTGCLQENSGQPAKCAGLREAFEADLQAYRATSAGIQPGYSVSVDQTSTSN